MDTSYIALAVLLLGMLVVVGGILILRLHAFLALVLGALVVGTLTPAAARRSFFLHAAAIEVLTRDDAGREVTLDTGAGAGVRRGSEFVVLRRDAATGQYVAAGSFKAVTVEPARTVAAAEDAFAIEDGDLVLTSAGLVAARGDASRSVGERIAGGFGGTCTKIGIVIALAAIIGMCLLESGAADRIVRSALRVCGEKGAAAAFLFSGFLLGIPVFFDTVFYLMIPLGKAMRMRTGHSYLLYVLAIVAGGTMAHSLVPPTPGPLFVADELSVDLGIMILAGCIVGGFTAAFGYVYAHLASRRWEVPLRESAEFSLADLKVLAHRDQSELPPLWLSLLPIVLPVLLISGATAVNMLADTLPEMFLNYAGPPVLALGNKNIALLISAVIAMAMLVWQRHSSLKELATSVQAAVASGGVIILITAAGGAFGGILQQTGVSQLIGDLPQNASWILITMAFLITTAIRTAQGSATVAMITAVGVLKGAGLDDPARLGCDPVYLALAIGCGSKPILWMNDSGFWVMCKMSGMTEGETMKYITPMTSAMGVVGLLVIILGVRMLPFPM